MTAGGRKLFVAWIAVGIVLGGLLFVAERSRNAKDDPDPAWQRPGFLSPPRPATRVGDTFPRAGRPLAMIFVRTAKGQSLFHDLSLQGDLTALGDVVVVTADGSMPAIRSGIASVVHDPRGQLARSFALRTPRDGGYPVGYALVDRAGMLRYATLDPHCIGMGQNEEIIALMRALK